MFAPNSIGKFSAAHQPKSSDPPIRNGQRQSDQKTKRRYFGPIVFDSYCVCSLLDQKIRH